MTVVFLNIKFKRITGVSKHLYLENRPCPILFSTRTNYSQWPKSKLWHLRFENEMNSLKEKEKSNLFYVIKGYWLSSWMGKNSKIFVVFCQHFRKKSIFSPTEIAFQLFQFERNECGNALWASKKLFEQKSHFSWSVINFWKFKFTLIIWIPLIFFDLKLFVFWKRTTDQRTVDFLNSNQTPSTIRMTTGRKTVWKAGLTLQLSYRTADQKIVLKLKWQML
jgi:hypothetical protein